LKKVQWHNFTHSFTRRPEILKELYENQFFSVYTVGIGDSLNDLPMLSAVDSPIFLKGEEDISLEVPVKNLTCVEGKGPSAWNEVILNIVDQVRI
ncbi:MAG: hypothetical protein ACPL6D_07775, partial [Thermodesulfobacteriota bacterium]